MTDESGTQPFKNIRYANATNADSDVQIEVHFEPDGGGQSPGSAYPSPLKAKPVVNGANVLMTEPQAMLPAGSLITKIDVKWNAPGTASWKTLPIPLTENVAMIEMVMVLQGPDYITAACFKSDKTCIGASSIFPDV